MAWIDTGSDEPKWIDDADAAAWGFSSGDREGFVSGGTIPKSIWTPSWGAAGSLFTDSLHGGTVKPEAIASLVNQGVPRSLIDQLVQAVERGRTGDHAAQVEVQRISEQIEDVVNPNRGYDSFGSFFGDALGGAAGMAGTLATNPAVLGALGGYLLAPEAAAAGAGE